MVNVGREVGKSLDAVAQYLDKDSTYGTLAPLPRRSRRAQRDIQVVDEAAGLLRVHGKDVHILREARDPRDIPWREHGVVVVVDTTGGFVDPLAGRRRSGRLAPRSSGGGRQGRRAELALQEQAEGRRHPDDAIMLINGINEYQFDPGRHLLVSGASCTTTALAHMLRPLLDRDLTRHMITAGMSTVHAATNSQQRARRRARRPAPRTCARSRSVLNNIILTSHQRGQAPWSR